MDAAFLAYKSLPNISKIEPFNGSHFKRWQEKVTDTLDVLNFVDYLTQSKPEQNPEKPEENYAELLEASNKSNKVCRHTIFSTLSNELYDISLARIGVASERMGISEVLMELNAIKQVFLGAGISGERLIRMKLAMQETSDIGFVDSLTNCTKLRALGLQVNGFGGVLPNSTTNLSTQLRSLVLGENQFVGNIPTGISFLENVTNKHD